MRQIVLDTETTGLSPTQGHRIIEIGCVELINRRLTGNTYHVYINPEREVDQGAVQVHGITNDFLEDKPLFIDCKDAFMEFIAGSELIIHNAPFDVGFLENEFKLVKQKDWLDLSKHCEITDTLTLARQKHPGQKNNLDALCKRYQINNEHREKHGALLDAEILADVYLAMTGGQSALALDISQQSNDKTPSNMSSQPSASVYNVPPLQPTSAERQAHQALVQQLEQACQSEVIWQQFSQRE